MNYQAWGNGTITGAQYFESIAFGAGVGAVSVVNPSEYYALLAGGFGGAANTAFNELQQGCSLDPSAIGWAFLTGAAGGFIAAEFQAGGAEVVEIPSSLFGPLRTFEVPGAAIGTAIGTYVGSR